MALNLNKDGENSGSKSNEPKKKGFNLNKENSPEESAVKGLNLSKGDTKSGESKLNLNKSSDDKPKAETTAPKGLNLTKSSESDTKPSLQKKPQSSGDSGAGNPAAVDDKKAKASGSEYSNPNDSSKSKASDEKTKQHPAATSTSAISAGEKKSKILVPLVIVALVGLGVFFFVNNSEDGKIPPLPPGGPVTPTSPGTPIPPVAPTPPVPPPRVDGSSAKGKTIATFSEGQFQTSEMPSSQLQAIKNHLSSNSSAKVVLTGYASSEGDESFNSRLSRKRAEAMKAYLVNQGVEASRVTAVAGGISNPIADNSTEKGRLENRRIEMELK